MGEAGAAARAAGVEVEASCAIVRGRMAWVRLPGEALAVEWPAGEIAGALGVAVEEVAGLRFLVTVRESRESGRVLSGFRPSGS